MSANELLNGTPSGGETNRRRRKPGDVVVAANGYTYIYVLRGKKLERILKHHIVAEKKYGRPPTDAERVVFKDGDRRNFSPDNIEYAIKNNELAALKRRRNSLIERIREAEGQLVEVERELKSKGVKI
jgi:HNH endonuclease